jgi:hypothetical protein
MDEPIAREDPVTIDRKIDEPGSRIARRRQDRVVLDAGEQDLVPTRRQHRIVPFRTPAGEDDLGRLRPDQGCNLLARILEDGARPPALGVR